MLRQSSHMSHLKRKFLNGNVCDLSDKDAIAHMLLEIDDSQKVLQVAVNYLGRKLNADRVDAGLGGPQKKRWLAQVDYINKVSSPPSTAGITLSNWHIAIQNVWRSSKPVMYDNVSENPLIKGELAKSLIDARCKSLLLRRIEVDQKPLGLICADYTERTGKWSSEKVERMDRFCQRYLGPILKESITISQADKDSKPTVAELRAIQLIAEGMSSKQVAWELKKSTRTIEHQLRNARVKLGAKNTVELISKAGNWL